jgi:hypothetical protein
MSTGSEIEPSQLMSLEGDDSNIIEDEKRLLPGQNKEEEILQDQDQENEEAKSFIHAW